MVADDVGVVVPVCVIVVLPVEVCVEVIVVWVQSAKLPWSVLAMASLSSDAVSSQSSLYRNPPMLQPTAGPPSRLRSWYSAMVALRSNSSVPWQALSSRTETAPCAPTVDVSQVATPTELCPVARHISRKLFRCGI